MTPTPSASQTASADAGEGCQLDRLFYCGGEYVRADEAVRQITALQTALAALRQTSSEPVALTDAEKVQLLYAECRAVDNGGLLSLDQMNLEDRIAMKDMEAKGLLRWDYLDAPVLRCGAWVRLTPAGYSAAHAARIARAERTVSPHASKAFAALQDTPQASGGE